MKFTAYFEQDPDSEDLLLPFPPEFILKMGWDEETELEWELTDEHHIILREKNV